MLKSAHKLINEHHSSRKQLAIYILQNFVLSTDATGPSGTLSFPFGQNGCLHITLGSRTLPLWTFGILF